MQPATTSFFEFELAIAGASTLTLAKIVKLLPKTRIEWLQAALLAVSAPLVIVTVTYLAAFVVHSNSRVLTPSWFLSDSVIFSGPCGMIATLSAIATLILSFVFLFIDHAPAAFGFLVVVICLIVLIFTPVVIHE